jgi:hypothetical protein
MRFSVGASPSRKEFIDNMELKITDDEFLGDTMALLRPTEKYDPIAACDHIKGVTSYKTIVKVELTSDRR